MYVVSSVRVHGTCMWFRVYGCMVLRVPGTYSLSLPVKKPNTYYHYYASHHGITKICQA